ncbi:hypothetical protein MMC17_000313 [Xylographa soralifera]|nr:hypothetical protein [Xylographa soralifera]
MGQEISSEYSSTTTDSAMPSLENVAAIQIPPEESEKTTTHDIVLPEAVSLDESAIEPEYPSPAKLAIITIALCLAIFLVALDTTIVATAIPRITDDFKALNDVGWYGSAYLVTVCSFQLLFGKLYTIFSIKWVFLIAIAIFELGSLLCGVAPTSNVLILGRAIAGLGCAGIFSGGLIVVAHSVPLHRRPAYTGLIGCMYGIASVAGPLLGGVFTDRLSWRWCFYINLPIGAVTVVTFVFFFRSPERAELAPMSFREKLKQIDIWGTLAFLPAMVCLLVGLQWGGTTYPWSSGRVVALLVIAALLFVAFTIIQIWKQEAATLPPRIITQRSICSGAVFSFLLGGAYFVLLYYLPVWFQAIQAVSATESGVRNLPLIMSHALVALLAGALITLLGYYTPFMLLSSVLMSSGAGLLTTWTPSTPSARWIGYQALFGLGSGLGMNQPLIAAQTVLALADVPIGTASVIFAQTFGGTIFITAAQNIFTNRLLASLQSAVPGLDPAVVLGTGATNLRNVVDPSFLPAVVLAYNGALTRTFYVALAVACLSIVGALGMEWKSVRGKPGAAVHVGG